MNYQPPAMVRQASANDLLAVAEIGKRFFVEGGLPGTIKPELFAAKWQSILSSGNGRMWVLDNGSVIGTLGVLQYEDLNDGTLVWAEAFWYVLPEHRGDGRKLFDVFESDAKKAGVGRLVMVHLLALNAKVMERFYRQRGYVAAETHYCKEIG